MTQTGSGQWKWKTRVLCPSVPRTRLFLAPTQRRRPGLTTTDHPPLTQARPVRRSLRLPHSSVAPAPPPLSPNRTAATPGGGVANSAVPAPPRVGISTLAPPAPGLPPPPPPLAYEFVRGALARSVASVSDAGRGRAPPTAVLVHGILGSRRNLAGFAERLVEGFPAWQVLLVDLRCHGESAAAAGAGAYGPDGSSPPPPPAHPGPHTVASSAADILGLLASLKLFPEVLVGHSFGGKVVMSMAAQFGAGGAALPRPVHVWVLDALPGAVRGDGPDAADHPARLVDALRSLPLPLPSRSDLAARLAAVGFSTGVARWAATNLRPAAGGDQTRLVWGFDLGGIRDMYDSYEADSLWPFLEAPPPGVEVNFVRAARSEYRWAGGDADRIRGLGHGVHDLPGAGHWVHAENPDGLFDILAPSFGGGVDLHVRRSAPGSPGLV